MGSQKQFVKAAAERKAFKLFAEKMAWDCSENNISSRPEPEPDIRYVSADETVGFELVEICDSTIAHQNAKLIAVGGASTIWATDPTSRIVTAKFGKRYLADCPIELLCYWNAMVISPDAQIADEIQEVVRSHSHCPFRRIWYFGEKSIYRWAPFKHTCERFDFSCAREPFWVSGIF